MSEVSRHQLLLRHTLGLGRGGPSCRNHFVASQDHCDLQDLIALEGKGLMRRIERPSWLAADSIVFCATDAGHAVAEAEPAKEMK